MSSEVEAPVCRVCHGESEPGRELFFPCKCDGSIKFVHQDCLQEWLKHARNKEKCELCGEQFKFKKIYKEGISLHLSIIEIMQELFPRMATIASVIFNTALSTICWVFVLPGFSAFWFKFCWCVVSDLEPETCPRKLTNFHLTVRYSLNIWYTGVVFMCTIGIITFFAVEVYRVLHKHVKSAQKAYRIAQLETDLRKRKLVMSKLESGSAMLVLQDLTLIHELLDLDNSNVAELAYDSNAAELSHQLKFTKLSTDIIAKREAWRDKRKLVQENNSVYQLQIDSRRTIITGVGTSFRILFQDREFIEDLIQIIQPVQYISICPSLWMLILQHLKNHSLLLLTLPLPPLQQHASHADAAIFIDTFQRTINTIKDFESNKFYESFEKLIQEFVNETKTELHATRTLADSLSRHDDHSADGNHQHSDSHIFPSMNILNSVADLSKDTLAREITTEEKTENDNQRPNTHHDHQEDSTHENQNNRPNRYSNENEDDDYDNDEDYEEDEENNDDIIEQVVFDTQLQQRMNHLFSDFSEQNGSLLLNLVEADTPADNEDDEDDNNAENSNFTEEIQHINDNDHIQVDAQAEQVQPILEEKADTLNNAHSQQNTLDNNVYNNYDGENMDEKDNNQCREQEYDRIQRQEGTKEEKYQYRRCPVARTVYPHGYNVNNSQYVNYVHDHEQNDNDNDDVDSNFSFDNGLHSNILHNIDPADLLNDTAASEDQEIGVFDNNDNQDMDEYEGNEDEEGDDMLPRNDDGNVMDMANYIDNFLNNNNNNNANIDNANNVNPVPPVPVNLEHLINANINPINNNANNDNPVVNVINDANNNNANHNINPMNNNPVQRPGIVLDIEVGDNDVVAVTLDYWLFSACILFLFSFGVFFLLLPAGIGKLFDLYILKTRPILNAFQGSIQKLLQKDEDNKIAFMFQYLDLDEEWSNLDLAMLNTAELALISEVISFKFRTLLDMLIGYIVCLWLLVTGLVLYFARHIAWMEVYRQLLARHQLPENNNLVAVPPIQLPQLQPINLQPHIVQNQEDPLLQQHLLQPQPIQPQPIQHQPIQPQPIQPQLPPQQQHMQQQEPFTVLLFVQLCYREFGHYVDRLATSATKTLLVGVLYLLVLPMVFATVLWLSLRRPLAGVLDYSDLEDGGLALLATVFALCFFAAFWLIAHISLVASEWASMFNPATQQFLKDLVPADLTLVSLPLIEVARDPSPLDQLQRIFFTQLPQRSFAHILQAFLCECFFLLPGLLLTIVLPLRIGHFAVLQTQTPLKIQLESVMADLQVPSELLMSHILLPLLLEKLQYRKAVHRWMAWQVEYAARVTGCETLLLNPLIFPHVQHLLRLPAEQQQQQQQIPLREPAPAAAAGDDQQQQQQLQPLPLPPPAELMNPVAEEDFADDDNAAAAADNNANSDSDDDDCVAYEQEGDDMVDVREFPTDEGEEEEQEQEKEVGREEEQREISPCMDLEEENNSSDDSIIEDANTAAQEMDVVSSAAAAVYVGDTAGDSMEVFDQDKVDQDDDDDDDDDDDNDRSVHGVAANLLEPAENQSSIHPIFAAESEPEPAAVVDAGLSLPVEEAPIVAPAVVDDDNNNNNNVHLNPIPDNTNTDNGNNTNGNTNNNHAAAAIAMPQQQHQPPPPPPLQLFWRYLLFLCLQLGCFSLVCCWIVHVPLTLGRWLLVSSGYLLQASNDLLNYPVGVILCWCLGQVLTYLYQEIKEHHHLQQQQQQQLAVDQLVVGGKLAYKWLLRSAQIVLGGVLWLVVLPLLLGYVLEVLCVIPFRTEAQVTPYFPVMQAWALGIVLLKLFTKGVLVGLFGDIPLRLELELTMIRGFAHFDFALFWHRIFVPIALPLCDLVLVPLCLGRVAGLVHPQQLLRAVISSFPHYPHHPHPSYLHSMSMNMMNITSYSSTSTSTLIETLMKSVSEFMLSSTNVGNHVPHIHVPHVYVHVPRGVSAVEVSSSSTLYAWRVLAARFSTHVYLLVRLVSVVSYRSLLYGLHVYQEIKDRRYLIGTELTNRTTATTATATATATTST